MDLQNTCLDLLIQMHIENFVHACRKPPKYTVIRNKICIKVHASKMHKEKYAASQSMYLEVFEYLHAIDVTPCTKPCTNGSFVYAWVHKSTSP